MDLRRIIQAIPSFDGRLWIVCLTMVSSCLYAQLPTNQRSKIISTADTVLLDTLSIIPGTMVLKVNGVEIPSDYYKIEYATAQIYFNLSKIYIAYGNQRNVEAAYKVFPILFSKKIRDENKHSLVVNKTDTSGTNKMIYNLNKVGNPLNETFKWEGINKSGSFTRGVSFGNTQDASVISAFNLQLSGKLNNDVEILASITDENVPIQPNGNTQTLQDFDKIFIQLSKGASKAIGGDFSIVKPKGYFFEYV